MKKILCKICKKEVKTNKYTPIIDKKQFPLCSKECFNKYLECWKDEKNFPENLNELINSKNNQENEKANLGHAQQFKSNKRNMGNSPEYLNKKYTKEEIDSFPDY